MKFAAAAITPGRANVCQKGTEPSAKSTQIVPLSGTPPVSAPASRAAESLLAVERAVDLGDLLRLGRLARLRRVVLGRLAAEVEPEAGEVDAVAAVGADLLQRGQQLLALVRLLRHLLGRPDLD